MEEICRVDEAILNCLDENEENALIEKKRLLMSQICSVSSNDTISISNGLKFMRMKLEKEYPEATDVLRMTKKLIQVSSKQAVAIHVQRRVMPPTKKKRVVSGPPYPRPPGAPQKGKVWCAEQGAWQIFPTPTSEVVESASSMMALQNSAEEI
jgi:hypothetical protein